MKKPLTPQQRGERAADLIYLRGLEAARREFDFPDPMEEGYEEPFVVRLPEPGPNDGPQPARILDADGNVIATLDPDTRERRPV